MISYWWGVGGFAVLTLIGVGSAFVVEKIQQNQKTGREKKRRGLIFVHFASSYNGRYCTTSRVFRDGVLRVKHKWIELWNYHD